MDRAERTGLGVAVVGHVVLFGLLSVGFLATPNPRMLMSDPVEVVLTDDIAPTASAPDPAREEPAPKLAPEEGPVEPTQAEPAPELPPAPRPEIRKPTPAPVPVPKPKPEPPAKPSRPAAAPKPQQTKPQAKPPRSTGRLAGILDGISTRPSNSSSTRSKAPATGALRKSIDTAIGDSIRPYWRPPSGVDIEQLVTRIRFQLKQDGSLDGEPVIVGQSGVTASNAAQKRRHAENAIKAIKQAAPFRLDPKYFNQWQTWTFDFDARLTK